MAGRDYLAAIRAELEAGRHQHRMGENILAAFGYVRRRQTAIDEIGRALEELGLQTVPTIDSTMPLRVPRIRFSLIHSPDQPDSIHDELTGAASEGEDDEEPVSALQTLVPAFRIAELEAADKAVECISPDASIAEAHTRMGLGKYSQLVVANGSTPRRQDIKGIVSFQSIAKALLNGSPSTVRECVDDAVPIVRSDADLKEVVPLLGVHDVVLVVGPDHRLQGIVTAWDLADEFAQLVDPFKRIGEVEARLRAVLLARLGAARIREFMSEHAASSNSVQNNDVMSEADGLTVGDLQRIVEHPSHWQELGLRGMDRATFVAALDRMRIFRNRLMHFRDPLTSDESQELSNFCDLVRQIQL